MIKCCLKKFVPFDQSKYGGATYARINTVYPTRGLNQCGPPAQSTVVYLSTSGVYLSTSNTLRGLEWLVQSYVTQVNASLIVTSSVLYLMLYNIFHKI